METQKQELRRLFDLTDADKDNFVTFNELIFLIQSGQLNWTERNRLKDALEKGDINKDNKISFEELHQYYLKEKLRPIFNSADRDKDNFVTVNELAFIIHRINSEEFRQLAETFKSGDINGDEKLSLEEFVKYWS